MLNNSLTHVSHVHIFYQGSKKQLPTCCHVSFVKLSVLGPSLPDAVRGATSITTDHHLCLGNLKPKCVKTADYFLVQLNFLTWQKKRIVFLGGGLLSSRFVFFCSLLFPCFSAFMFLCFLLFPASLLL